MNKHHSHHPYHHEEFSAIQLSLPHTRRTAHYRRLHSPSLQHQSRIVLIEQIGRTVPEQAIEQLDTALVAPHC